MTCLSSILFVYVYRYQTSPIFQNIRKGSMRTFYVYSLPFAIIFMLLDEASHYLFDSLCDKYYIDHKKFPDPESRKKRCYTFVKWAYTDVYYAFMSIYSYYILLESDILPPWLGGSGDPHNMYRNGINIVGPLQKMEFVYGIQMGKHIARTLIHSFIKPQGNYYEYLLHHLMSTFLIAFSFLMNYWYVGLLVLIIHDTSDVFLSIGRAYMDFKYPKAALRYIFPALSISVWILCRIIIFWSCCIYPSVSAILDQNMYKPNLSNPNFQHATPEIQQIAWLPSLVLIIFLFLLLVLQLFWTYFILIAAIKVVKGKKKQN